MTQVVYARLESEVGGFAGWCPDTAPEPVAWNVVIWVGGARSTKTGASLGAPLGTVDGESSPAVLAAASARRVGAERAMPIAATSLIRLGEPETIRIWDDPQRPTYRAPHLVREQ